MYISYASNVLRKRKKLQARLGVLIFLSKKRRERF
jgi:hypothetical protein